MKIECTKTSASFAEDDLYQVLFQESEAEDSPFLLLQTGCEYDGDENPIACYVETQDPEFTGLIFGVRGLLRPTGLVLSMPDRSDPIDVEFTVSEEELANISKALRVIFGDFLKEEGEMPTKT